MLTNCVQRYVEAANTIFCCVVSSCLTTSYLLMNFPFCHCSDLLLPQLSVCGTLAYVSQTAWIQSGTVQDNILFGRPLNKEKYKEVIKNTSLEKDLEDLPFRDLTEIRERGVNLSGDKKQRIQLDHALYQDANIYLLDDPFSALDAHTATNLFKVHK